MTIYISIHALRGEGDFLFFAQSIKLPTFLSTPSVGRATPLQRLVIDAQPISIHALRGEGDFIFATLLDAPDNFYPRPPWGGRREFLRNYVQGGLFLSTPSVGRATQGYYSYYNCPDISIHALRGEGDRKTATALQLQQNFYPRPPWGGRLAFSCVFFMCLLFLSTPSVGRATGSFCLIRLYHKISIHALRGEGDPTLIWLSPM